MKLTTRILQCAAIGFSAIALASCAEKLDNEAGCPILCPDQGGSVESVTIEAVSFDSTVSSAAQLGEEGNLLLALGGDSLDLRPILRFDTIPQRYQPNLGDTATVPVTFVDSAALLLSVDSNSVRMNGPLTIEAFDVDTVLAKGTVSDTGTAALLPLFREDRLLGRHTYAKADLVDTVRLPLSDSAILSKAQSGDPLRIGLRAISGTSVVVSIFAVESGAPVQLVYRVSADTAIAPFLLTPYSRTPLDNATLAEHYSDYTIVAKSPGTPPANTLQAGGYPPNRIYMRFEIPSYIVDSSTVVQSSLILTQLPNRSFDPSDSVAIQAGLVLAGSAVTDPARAAQILANLSLPALAVAVGDSGQKKIEIAPVFGLWGALDPAKTPRALVLLGALEGISPLEARFFSTDAAPGLRPKLEISFVRHATFGLP